jgi:hypothetical protein
MFLQVEDHLYTPVTFSAGSVQLRSSPNFNPFSEASIPILYPLQASGTLHKSRLSDKLLPGIKVEVGVSLVEARFGPQQLTVLRGLFAQKEDNAARAGGSSQTTGAALQPTPDGWPCINPRSFGEVSRGPT